MKKTLIIGTLFSVLCLSNAFALDKPQAAKEDQRVLYTDFRADEVYPVTAASELLPLLSFPLLNRFKVMEAAFLLPGNF